MNGVVNHTRKSVEEYRNTRSEEWVHKQKKIFIERGLEELERLRSNNESKPFHQKLNRSRKDFQPRTILSRNKEGTLLNKEDDILKRWAEHFDELLNKEFLNQNVTRQEFHQAYSDIDEPTPTLNEIENAIQKLKDNKAPGIDLIQAKLIKKASPDFVECMYQLITKIWTTEIILEGWNWSIICPIHKKGDVTICSNYIRINLLYVTYKIFFNILFNRLMPYVQPLVITNVVIVGNSPQ